MEDCAQAIATQEKSVRQRMKAHGRAVPEQEILNYCKNEYDNNLAAREVEIYKTFQTTETACKRAWKKYRKHAKIQRLEARIVAIADIFDPKEVELPDDFTEDTFISV